MTICAFILGSLTTFGQAPKKINYQAVARDTETGVELIRQEIFVIAKIRHNGPNGNIVYQEEHNGVQTNSFGLFGLAIGSGQANEGNFGNVNWGDGNYWLEIDVDAGNGLETLGAMQFMSVPYALHAETVSDKDDADADPENEKITEFSLLPNGTTISLTEAGTTRTIELPPQTDGDSDPENELISSFSLGENGILNISEGGENHTADLSGLNTDDADADPENELISSFEYNPVTAIMSLSEGSMTWSHDLSGLAGDGTPDGDSDPNNEHVTGFGITGSNLRLSQSGTGQTFEVALSDLATNDADADPTNEIQNLTLSGDMLSITGSSNPLNVDLSQYRNDADSDPNNEHVTGFGIVGPNLRLSQPGTGPTFNVPLSAFASNDADSDPTNEKILNWTSTPTGYTFAEAGTNYTINRNDADADATNELVTSFGINGSNLRLLQAGSGATFNVPLSALADADSDPNNEHVTGFGVVGPNLRLSQPGTGQTFNVPLSAFASNDADADPTNEKILNWTSTPTGYTFTEAGTNYTINRNDADADATNELVSSFGINGSNLRLQQAGSGATFNVPLSAFASNDADSDPTNEKILNWTSTPTGYTFTEAGTNYTITRNDADADATNELVTSFGINGSNLRLQQAGSGATFNVPLSALAVDDADASPTNELVTSFGVNGANLRLQQAGSGVTFNVPLSALASDDADADPNNEKQTLTEVLTYTGPLGSSDGRNAGGNKIINLGTPTSNGDAATKQYVDALVHAGDVSGTATATKVEKIQGIGVQNVVPGNGMILSYNSGTSRWEPRSPSAIAAATQTGYYSIDPTDFTNYQKDGKIDKLNMVIHDGDASFVTIYKKNDGDFIAAPFHLPHGAQVDEVKIFYKIKENNNRNLQLAIRKKEIATGAITSYVIANYTANFDNNNLLVDIHDLTSFNDADRIIDNSKYSYTVRAKFNTGDDFNDLDDADIQVHGVIFKYTK